MIVCVALLWVSVQHSPLVNLTAKSRTFYLTYDIRLIDLAANDDVRVWLPVPSNTPDQQIEIVDLSLPGKSSLKHDPKYRNRILYATARPDKAGELPLRVVYLVTRNEVRAESTPAARDEADLFLKPDTKVPTNGKHLNLLAGKKLPHDSMKLSRALYDIVNTELRYSKEGTGWGNGDVNWVCDSKYGNCSDFHSLFIALARTYKMPAKFEIGFSLPEKRGSGTIAGYHCWAKFLPAGRGWIPVDVSMANQNPKLKDYCFGNLTEDHVTFSVGRDLTLVPKQDGPPLNFFVYPYAEVNGKVLPAERIAKKFSFEDVDR